MPGTTRKKEESEDAKVEKAEAQVEKTVDKETEQGFRGEEVDPTPNEHYTVSGVAAGKPVPEADKELAVKVGSGKFRA